VAECRKAEPEIAGIGVAVPGVVANGTVTANNLDWQRFPLAASLGIRDTPVLVANDMSAGALGELTFGRARGMRNVIYLTVSTGIGSGIILDGEVYRGANGSAGEVGHTVVDLNGLLCGCGRRGCWEMMASGTAHGRRVREAYASGTWPNLDHEPTPAEVTERAREGDRAARALVLRTARYLGIGVTNLANLYDPEAVIFTGGFARSNWDLIREYLENEVREQALVPSVQLLLTSLGDDAGLLGAASLVFHHLRKESA
jgi:glucokinase